MADQISGPEAIRAQSERSVRLPDDLQRTHPTVEVGGNARLDVQHLGRRDRARQGILFTGDIMTAA
jgi:hypothetical protein